MHCNSLRTACFVVLEHFVFTITTVVCALPIANRRWGRVARVSHALCSQIQVFPTWRIVFLYFLCFFLCLCSQIEAPLFPVSPSLFLIAFLMHRVLRNKRSKCLSRGHQCFSVRIRKSHLRKSYLMSFFWSGTSFPSFFTYPLYFCQMYECLNPWHLLSHSKLELIVFFCDTQLITINFNWSTVCAWVRLEALTKRRKAPHIAWYQTRVF